MLDDRKLHSSLELPSNPQDFYGIPFLVAERGTDYFVPWDAVGNSWQPRGPCYVGSVSGLPSASNCAIGAKAIVDVAAPGGLTRAPSSGVKMRRLALVVDYQRDGTTKAWKPDGAQTLWVGGGTGANPVGADWIATAGTSIVAEIGQIPAGLLAVADLELFWRIAVGRKTTAVGTADVLLAIGPTPGTVGTGIDAVAALTANVAAIAWLEGSLWSRNSSSSYCTYSNSPQSKANSAASTAVGNDLTAAQTLQVVLNSATAGDIFNVSSFTIGVR